MRASSTSSSPQRSWLQAWVRVLITFSLLLNLLPMAGPMSVVAAPRPVLPAEPSQQTETPPAPNDQNANPNQGTRDNEQVPDSATSSQSLTASSIISLTTPIQFGRSQADRQYLLPLIIVNDPTVPPTANFMANRLEGYAPLTVQFQNQSVKALSSEWDFGDGTTSTERNPSHVYRESGTYDVTLTVGNKVGSDVMTRTGYITVNDSEIDFRMDTGSGLAAGTAPMTVTFSSLLTGTLGLAQEGLEIERYVWDFGDGTLGEGITATHVYAESGVY